MAIVLALTALILVIVLFVETRLACQHLANRIDDLCEDFKVLRDADVSWQQSQRRKLHEHGEALVQLTRRLDTLHTIHTKHGVPIIVTAELNGGPFDGHTHNVPPAMFSCLIEEESTDTGDITFHHYELRSTKPNGTPTYTYQGTKPK